MKSNTFNTADISDYDVARLLQLYSELQQPEMEFPGSLTLDAALQEAIKPTCTANGLT